MMAALSHDDLQRIRSIATTYRTLVLLVGAQWVTGWLGKPSYNLGGPTGSDGFGALFIVAAFAVACILAWKGYQLAALLGRAAPVIWAIGMFIPLINLLCLGLLSSASQAFCKQHGIRVGFLGPDLDDVARLEREARDTQSS
jgi:hypothetical protein